MIGELVALRNGLNCKEIKGLMRALLCIILLALLISPAVNAEIKVGVADHLVEIPNDKVVKSLDLMQAARIKMVRFDVNWSAAEREKGVLRIPQKWDFIVNNAIQRGIEPILILDYGNRFYDAGGKPISDEAVMAFARYAKAVATHFKGRVKYLEIWNEWDGMTGRTVRGSGQDYAKLVDKVYPQIKAIDQNIKVIVASFSPGALREPDGKGIGGQMYQFIKASPTRRGDIIGLHLYVWRREKGKNGIEEYSRQLKQALDLVRSSNAYRGVPIYITESGWTTAKTKYGVGECEQHNLLVGAISVAEKMGVSGFIIYSMRDGGRGSKDNESGFGLLRNNWVKKPSYDVLTINAPTACASTKFPTG